MFDKGLWPKAYTWIYIFLTYFIYVEEKVETNIILFIMFLARALANINDENMFTRKFEDSFLHKRP